MLISTLEYRMWILPEVIDDKREQLLWEIEPPPRTQCFNSASGEPSVVVILFSGRFPISKLHYHGF